MTSSHTTNGHLDRRSVVAAVLSEPLPFLAPGLPLPRSARTPSSSSSSRNERSRLPQAIDQRLSDEAKDTFAKKCIEDAVGSM
jgi:hypothetical protein